MKIQRGSHALVEEGANVLGDDWDRDLATEIVDIYAAS